MAATSLQGIAEGAMWRLPTDVLQAMAEAEAAFREAIGKREERSWHKIQTAISTAMVSSFDVFSTQACLAVQQSQLTVPEARSGAEQFLKDRANALHGWLVPVMNHYVPGCPYRFRRYNSEDRFVFCRDMVEAVQSSNAWTQFLRRVAVSARQKQSDQPDPSPPVSPVAAHAESQMPPVSDDLKRWRRNQLKEYRDNTGSTVEAMGSQIGATARTVQAIAAEDRSRFKTYHQIKLLKLINVSHERWYGA